jgi:hypothetical protein
MAAYGAFQGWDGLLQFDYAGPDWADMMEGNFDVGNKPHVFATWPAAARLFLKGQVQPGEMVVVQRTEEEVAQGVQIGEGLPARVGLRDRVAFATGPSGSGRAPVSASELQPVARPAMSSTEQLTWDAEAGLITVNAPSSAVRLGFATGPVEVGSVSFDVKPEFAVLAVTALDDQPISGSTHLLVTATARAENSGMVYSGGKRRAVEAGHGPILMEPVRGKAVVALQAPVRAVEAYALDSVGRRRSAVEVGGEGNVITIPLDADAFWYEVVIRR